MPAKVLEDSLQPISITMLMERDLTQEDIHAISRELSEAKTNYIENGVYQADQRRRTVSLAKILYLHTFSDNADTARAAAYTLVANTLSVTDLDPLANTADLNDEQNGRFYKYLSIML